MKVILLTLFLLLVTFLNVNGLPVKAKAGLIAKSPLLSSNKTLELTDVTCDDSVTAYFSGTFKRNDGSQFNAQFQLKLQVGRRDPRLIWLQIQHWNSSYLNEGEAQIGLWHEQSGERCSITDKNCAISLTTKQTFFVVEIWTHDTDWFPIRVLNFPVFFNSFILNRSFNQCSKYKLIDDDYYSPDTNLYDFCACCGDHYNPDSQMKCPANPWA